VTSLLAASSSNIAPVPPAPTWLWIAFALAVAFFLYLDMFVMHKGAHRVDLKEAVWANIFWAAIGLGFGLVVLWQLNGEAATQYYGGYLLERALSVDNVFVFAVVFAYFKVPAKLQNGVLFWGIVMALVMRGVFIFAGVELVQRYDWILYIFGALLFLTGVRMATHNAAETDPSKNLALRGMRKLMPVSHSYHDDRYFIDPEDVASGEEFDKGRKPGERGLLGRKVATPLAAAIMVVAFTDLIFAIDSIPAILAISQDKFIIYTSNAFAILGMRALYFLLADAIDRFVYLQYGLALVLVFVGVKMMIHDYVHISTPMSLLVIAVVAGVSIVWSLLATRGQEPMLPGEPPPGEPPWHIGKDDDRDS
jgi:tellurite resistance protein TerC